MYRISTLKNGLRVIFVPLPNLESVTSLVAVGAGSRYETPKNNGVAHFLEHMFFKGSRKYPTAEIISYMVDGVGAVNNAFTHKEFTGYWIKSAAKHLELGLDILSSELSEPLLAEEEIEREKGVIVEELRMHKDNPGRWIWDLFYQLLYGNTSMGRSVIGDEKTITSFNREDFLNYMNSFYSPKNLVVVVAGKINDNEQALVEKYFSNLSVFKMENSESFKAIPQTKPRVNVFYKKTDQAHLALGTLSYSRFDERRYAAHLLALILGEGMSSRLFLQIRERRGLAYRVFADLETYKDTGIFVNYAGLKIEKTMEGLEVIKAELQRLATELVPENELNKAKEMLRGHTAIREESTNYLAEYYGLEEVLAGKIETPQEYLSKIDKVTAQEIKEVAADLFSRDKLNLQVIGPFRSQAPFEKILAS